VVVRAQPNSTQIRVAREAFLSGEDTPRDVRTEIVESWRRSKLSGVDGDRLQIPFLADFEPECNKLFLAATPILERCAERLLDANSSIVLADRRARVLGRWSGDRSLDRGLERASVARGFLLSEGAAGTNGVGTVVEEGRPVKIVGSEHFAEQFCMFTCVGAPIRHPMTRQIEGVLDIACRELEANGLLLPMALELASEIEQELYLHASERERALLESFLREVKTSTRPVVSISEQLMMANAAAARLLDGTDQVVLWEQASLAVTSQRERSIELTLADGRPVQARCKPVELDTRTIGVVVELDLHSLEATAARRWRPPSVAASGDSLVGQTPAWRQAEALTRRVAASGLPILFLGEPGTGKTALARLAHVSSGDPAELTVFDCALVGLDGIAAWLQQLRDRLSGGQGAVLLRRIDQLDEDASMAICALVDAGPEVGTRLLATATAPYGSDPDVPQPLLDRLGVVRVTVPALRQRPEDIAVLAGEFVRRHAPRRPLPRFAPEVLQALLRLDWPGNVRQLENLVRGLVAAGRLSDIRLEDLPEEVRRQTARRPLSRLEQMELDEILAALRQTDGNKVLAAAALGISRSTLYRKLRGFGVEIDRAIF
jgi:sigma-54 dependent transcriptional regulator, acetoin dehydrogenase operon transcriptional activator AcoR